MLCSVWVLEIQLWIRTKCVFDKGQAKPFWISRVCWIFTFSYDIPYWQWSKEENITNCQQNIGWSKRLCEKWTVAIHANQCHLPKPYSVGAWAVELKLILMEEVNIQLDFSYYTKCFQEDEENFTALSWPPNSQHLIPAISTKQGSSIILNYDKWQFCWCFLWTHLHPEFSHWGYHLSCACFSFFELVWIDFSSTTCSVTIGFMFGLLIHTIEFINIPW